MLEFIKQFTDWYYGSQICILMFVPSLLFAQAIHRTKPNSPANSANL